MLHKHTRRRLNEHDWETYHRLEKNPSQSVRRLVDSARLAIEDLSLIARKLPDSKQQEIFNESTIEPFLNSLFFIDQSQKVTQLRNTNVGLASLIAEEGIKHCLSTYRKWNKDSPESARPTLDYLERSIQICREIGYKSLKYNIEHSFSTEKNKLICIWENRLDSDFERFAKYLVERMKLSISDVSIRNIPTEESYRYYYGIWDDWGDPEDGESNYLGALKINFSLNKKEGRLLDNNEGTVTFYNHQGKEINEKNIKILKYGSKHLLVEA